MRDLVAFCSGAWPLGYSALNGVSQNLECFYQYYAIGTELVDVRRCAYQEKAQAVEGQSLGINITCGSAISYVTLYLQR